MSPGATAYVCGLGLFEFYLNGAKIGDQVLSPGLTDYDKRVQYVTFDVTRQIAAGRNAAGLILGNGRYWAPRGKVPGRPCGRSAIRKHACASTSNMRTAPAPPSSATHTGN